METLAENINMIYIGINKYTKTIWQYYNKINKYEPAVVCSLKGKQSTVWCCAHKPVNTN